MASIEPFENGDRASRFVAYAVSLPYALFPLAYLGYSIYSGASPDMMIWFLVITGFIVSAYKIWGKKNVTSALDEAREATGQNDSSSGNSNE